MRKRYILVVSILTGILLTLATWGAVEGIICNSGTLISQCGSWLHNSDIEQYAEIFTQLKDAQIQIPTLILTIVFICSTAVVYLLYSMLLKKLGFFRVSGCVVLLLFLFLYLLLIALLFADVNTIRFGLALKAVLQFI